MKECKQCKQLKSLEYFNKNIGRKDGRLERCRKCMNFNRRQRYKNDNEYRSKIINNAKCYRHSKYGQESIKKYRHSELGRARDKRVKDNNPIKWVARNRIGDAVRTKKIPPARELICSCGNQADQYHHHNGYEPDYWLDVIPVCLECHQELG